MKELPEDHRFLSEVFGINKETKNAPDKFIGGLQAVNDKICKRCMTARDIKRILGLSYRQINEWEQRQVRFSKRRSKKKGSWRLFSIEDAFSFAIIKALRYLKIPLSRNRKLVESIRSSNIVQTILIYFAEGRKTFFFHDNDTLTGFYVENRKNSFDQQILTAIKPIVFIPLNDLFLGVLKQSDREDFHVDFDKETQKPAFYVDGRPVELSDRVPVDTKTTEAKNNKEHGGKHERSK